MDRIFGPKFHKEFPRQKRLSGGDCPGEGFYPSTLGNGQEYKNEGLDLQADVGSEVKHVPACCL